MSILARLFLYVIGFSLYICIDNLIAALIDRCFDSSISYLLWYITYLSQILTLLSLYTCSLNMTVALPIKEEVHLSLALDFRFLHVTCFG